MPQVHGTFNAAGQVSTGIALRGSPNFFQIRPGAIATDRFTVETRPNGTAAWAELRAGSLTGSAGALGINGAGVIGLPSEPNNSTVEVRLRCDAVTGTVAYSIITNGGSN